MYVAENIQPPSGSDTQNPSLQDFLQAHHRPKLYHWYSCVCTSYVLSQPNFSPQIIRLRQSTYILASEGAVVSLILETDGLSDDIRLAFVVLDISRHESLPRLSFGWLLWRASGFHVEVAVRLCF